MSPRSKKEAARVEGSSPSEEEVEEEKGEEEVGVEEEGGELDDDGDDVALVAVVIVLSLALGALIVALRLTATDAGVERVEAASPRTAEQTERRWKQRSESDMGVLVFLFFFKKSGKKSHFQRKTTSSEGAHFSFLFSSPLLCYLSFTSKSNAPRPRDPHGRSRHGQGALSKRMRLERAREREEEKDEWILRCLDGRERRRENSTSSTTPDPLPPLSASPTPNTNYSQVPFAMISLLDLVRHKSPPPNLKCRMLLPSSGSRSASLWDVDSATSLQAWLDENADADCSHEVVEVQEDFALGIGETLARARAGEKVAAGAARAAAVTTGAAKELDAKYKVTAGARAAAGAVKGIGAKALEDERVAAAASVVGTGFSKGWRWAKGAAAAAAGKVVVGGGGGNGGGGGGGGSGSFHGSEGGNSSTPPPLPYGDVAGSMPPPGGAR